MLIPRVRKFFKYSNDKSLVGARNRTRVVSLTWLLPITKKLARSYYRAETKVNFKFGQIAVLEELFYLGRCWNRPHHHHLQTVKNYWEFRLQKSSMWDCETCDLISTENCDAKRLRPICRSSVHAWELFLIWPRGCGGSGGGFSSTGLSAEGSWEGLGFGNRRRRFPAGLSRFLQTRGCGKQKSLQRPPTIRFTDSVLRTRFLIIILRFEGGVGGGCGGGGGGDFNISPNSKICPSNTAIHQVQTLETYITEIIKC